MKVRLFKGGLIGLGALLLSTLGIFASDTFHGINSRINNLANLNGEGMCPRGMSLFNGSDGMLCVDSYEVSPGESCPNTQPKSVIESEKNAETKGCYAASEKGKEPWTYVTLTQAQRICAESGKRLPTSDEWYALALGTDQSSCMTSGSAPRKTEDSECVSSTGAFDMIGNVWEWVDETVIGLEFRGRTLPQEGYVSETDASGIAITTDSAIGSDLYGKDYFWSKSDGVYGMIRGGFFGSGADAGFYTVNATVPTNFATQGVGFRCVK